MPERDIRRGRESGISRRFVAKGIGATLAASAFLEPSLIQQQCSARAEPVRGADLATHAGARLQIGVLLCSRLSALDLVGPRLLASHSRMLRQCLST